MARVWDASPAKGGKLLILLALANYADDAGVCWPDQSTLAQAARLTERQARTVLQELVDDGDLLMDVGRGRGNPTMYCLICGLSPAEQEEKPRIHRHTKTSSDSPNGDRPKGEVVDSERGAPLHEAYHCSVDCSKADELVLYHAYV